MNIIIYSKITFITIGISTYKNNPIEAIFAVVMSYTQH